MTKRRGGVGVRRNTALTAGEQIRSLKANLRETKMQCASQQRMINRLLANNPPLEAECEIIRLEALVTDLLDCNVEAESECWQLRRQLLQEGA